MLRNPPPGDWLMARRNYQAWSYSPLSQMTRDNVKDLQLAWVWAMNEGGANQPTPLVHDGVMYLINTLNTVQALDAATGELIWENHVGPGQRHRLRLDAEHGDLRRQDLFFATTDARLVALDAPHRQVGLGNRRSPIARRASPTPAARSSSARASVIQGLQGCDRYRDERCFISAYDAETGQAAVEVPHRRA